MATNSVDSAASMLAAKCPLSVTKTGRFWRHEKNQTLADTSETL